VQTCAAGCTSVLGMAAQCAAGAGHAKGHWARHPHTCTRRLVPCVLCCAVLCSYFSACSEWHMPENPDLVFLEVSRQHPPDSGQHPPGLAAHTSPETLGQHPPHLGQWGGCWAWGRQGMPAAGRDVGSLLLILCRGLPICTPIMALHRMMLHYAVLHCTAVLR